MKYRSMMDLGKPDYELSSSDISLFHKHVLYLFLRKCTVQSRKTLIRNLAAKHALDAFLVEEVLSREIRSRLRTSLRAYPNRGNWALEGITPWRRAENRALLRLFPLVCARNQCWDFHSSVRNTFRGRKRTQSS